MADSFLIKRGGSVKNAFAFIYVTFPVGSLCVCSDGNTILRAEDTTGECMFGVPNAGAWSVTCSDGERTSTESVSISIPWQFEKITLYYAFNIYNNGTIETAKSGGLSSTKIYGGTGTYSTSNSDGVLTATVTYSSGTNGLSVLFRTVNKIDITNYTTIHMFVQSCSLTSGSNTNLTARFGICSSDPSGEISGWSLPAYTKIIHGVSDTEYTVDISSFTGEYYPMLGVFAGSGGTSTVKLTRWWLD